MAIVSETVANHPVPTGRLSIGVITPFGPTGWSPHTAAGVIYGSETERWLRVGLSRQPSGVAWIGDVADTGVKSVNLGSYSDGYHAVPRELRIVKSWGVALEPGASVGEHRTRIDLLALANRMVRIVHRTEMDTTKVAAEADGAGRILDDLFSEFESDALEVVGRVPDDAVVGELKRIVLAMYRRWSADYDVYAMDEQTAAVEVRGAPGRGLLLVCEPGRGALCVVSIDGNSHRQRYEDSAVLPDRFIADGMRTLGFVDGARTDGS